MPPPITPSQFLAALAAGMFIAALAAIFARLDAVARRLIVVRKARPHLSWRRDED